MSSILPPHADREGEGEGEVGGGGFRSRLAAHRAMLGVLLDETVPELPSALLDDLDFVIVRASSSFGFVRAVRERYRDRLAVLALVASQQEASLCSDADGLIAEAGTAVADLDIAAAVVDVELSEAGRARLVASAPAAVAAFGSGADVVVYDLPRMMSELLAGLGAARPVQAEHETRPPVVMLSGMLGDDSLWDAVAWRLADHTLPVPLRIDLDDSVVEMAASVLAAAPRRFVLAGHSLGAIVALEIMRQQPERVARLALLNASARGPSEQQLDSWSRSQRRVDAGEFGQVAAELAVATLAAPRRADVLLVAANRAMADAVGADGFKRQLSAQITRPDSRGSVGDIEVPVLVLSGELDEICPPSLQQELAEHCPTAELVTIAGSGHMSPLESPEAVAAALLGWLQAQ